MAVDLTPFGFTPTESLVYATLLRLGPATGYAVARASRLARANAYAALDGLVARGAAARAVGRPAVYRPVDPQSLLALVAARHGEAFDRLAAALAGAARSPDPATRSTHGLRAVANVVIELVARAERQVSGVLAAALWRPTLPAWRRAAGRAAIDLRIAGDVPEDAARLGATPADAGSPTILLVDDAYAVTTAGAADDPSCVWTTDPLLVDLTRRALRAPAS